ncbi:acyl-CoA carboxylase subunit beta [Horticoccus luteus]|uniref:Acyl-CoA carboxylase subunit beta n=1 Tax=Horticoccus luteus TaxID=2862869 RepID=A0A8F9TUB0_9BACT|nr:acyl-CoA carboxylase subunit beta [Horticoccus luteus]QYM79185.1 acyl-CoA carboxylase subunit beta [Horticoccus luteus]
MKLAAETSPSLLERCHELAATEAALREGGGPDGLARQHKLGRLFARERLAALLDDPDDFLELGLWAAHGLYPAWGQFAAAGVITGIGRVSGHPCMLIANDATVKAGAFVPMTCKKVLRAQRIAFENNLPLIYLVDSAGVFLPMQDEIFPDEDDFGRIFRNNAVLSAAAIPQYAAIMGNCVAGGAYLPVLCDKILMTEGSGLYLAGPTLVKAAIGQETDSETLGGATMHAEISGTVDFKEKDDPACLARLKELLALLPAEPATPASAATEPEFHASRLYELVSLDGRKEYDARDLLRCLVDAGTLNEYKTDYGQSIVCAYARLGGHPVGLVANQRTRVQSPATGLQMPGVIYADSADKAARFIMDCNQTRLPLIFFQDVSGFMVGKDAEHSGIIRSGAKMVNALSNSTVPKITVIVGGSYGAGHYAMCGKAFDPRFIFAWPNARYAVMGGTQAADTVFHILSRGAKDRPAEELAALRERVKNDYVEQTDIRYGAARGWVDAIIPPHDTRQILLTALALSARPSPRAHFHTGVLQV